ncbi:MAG TPA: TetR/AcrR family transcriptional regulator [Pirellulales bacterium]|jgi:AcrR family transcriptional regulator|nr:TetR/AcrR family transcriptional regulator [Pirellulales bacterium]
MRITAEEKRATRRRIVEAAVDLFRSQGFDTTTTRDIARAAGIAAGTLFNYFETKEALVAGLAAEALSRAHAAWKQESDRTSPKHRPSLDEELFALIAAELRQLRPLRKFMSPFLETALSPLVAARKSAADELRVAHLERVAEIAGRQGVAEITPVAMQMYWALYAAALAFWAADKSPRQEDTLALLDESLQMFTAWLQGQTGGSKTERT